MLSPAATVAMPCAVQRKLPASRVYTVYVPASRPVNTLEVWNVMLFSEY